MNEAGLAVGVLFYPGFAQFQEPKPRPTGDDDRQRRCRQLSILSNFKTVDEGG